MSLHVTLFLMFIMLIKALCSMFGTVAISNRTPILEPYLVGRVS